MWCGGRGRFDLVQPCSVEGGGGGVEGGGGVVQGGRGGGEGGGCGVEGGVGGVYMLCTDNHSYGGGRSAVV